MNINYSKINNASKSALICIKCKVRLILLFVNLSLNIWNSLCVLFANLANSVFAFSAKVKYDELSGPEVIKL